jgi:hypothetical protein
MQQTRLVSIFLIPRISQSPRLSYFEDDGVEPEKFACASFKKTLAIAKFRPLNKKCL